MSEQQAVGIPEWTLGDRLAKALTVAGLSVADMAEHLGVSRNTISNYTGDRTRVPKATLMVWALRTGVPLEWLLNGDTGSTTTPDPDPGERTALDRLTATKRSRSHRDTRGYLDAA